MKKEVKKKKNKDTKQDKALVATFIGLIVLVVILAIIALNMKNFKQTEIENLTIPILEENSESEFSIQVDDMKPGDKKEYILEVSNYKGTDILKKELTYDVDITPAENTTVKVYKNNSKKSSLTKDDLLIENNKLQANKKKVDTYRIEITASSTLAEEEQITIKINS